MIVTIYHNSRCSKSRETFALLEANGIEPVVIEYLKTPPDYQTIHHLLKLLELTPRELMRMKESEYKAQNLDNTKLSDDDLINALIKTPKLIERPIVVVDNNKAVIGRPPDNILSIIK